MKQQTLQRYIFKIHSSRLRKSKWDLTLPLIQARKNEEVISINDSQMIRWIDELNGATDCDTKAYNIRKEIKFIRKQETTLKNRRAVRRLYEQLDEIQFKKDYICLIIDTKQDYKRACRGFKINGVKYSRLLGTNGGVKNSTIVFVNSEYVDELRKRIDNGRDMSVELVPAKLEAYRALTCSGSIPVSFPKGILVVNDCETEFLEDIIHLTDENLDEPELTHRKNETIKLNESDGYGLILPSLASRWSDELQLDYMISGANTRCSWEKGMVYTFDFIDFADNVAKSRVVKDAWGNGVDIHNVEMILTTSMLKLWKSYNSIDHYIECCIANKYTFGIAKTCPKELESERQLNYQFIQSYDLDDDQIDKLIAPTMQYINDILINDYRKAILFLRGKNVNEDTVMSIDNDFSKALMIEPKIFDDPFVKKRIYQMIRKIINDAKIGVINVHGNYSIVSGDPYSLCQSMFGMNVTGLLSSGELYNRYWVDIDTERVACFRAPMTCHNNIRVMNVVSSDEAKYWYQYMNTCTIINSWDSTAYAMNGMDKDGDLVLLTDNEVLVDNYKPLPTIMCVQRNASKVIPTESNLIQSNIDSFGDEIGKTTNWITSMFEVRSRFSPESKEYKTLSYRIMCGQLYQQNAIDKAKGIIAKPMPKHWYNKFENIKNLNSGEFNEEEFDFNISILADKKPYFMRYIYPSLASSYDLYIKNTDKKCYREFRISIYELLSKSPAELNEREAEFIKYYYLRMPVGINDCTMNKICRKFEDAFDQILLKNASKNDFDYSVMKSGAEYTSTQYKAIQKLYKEYIKASQNFLAETHNERLDDDEIRYRKKILIDRFLRECEYISSNSTQLCDILLDICYTSLNSKQFCWDICGATIIENLLSRYGAIHFPVRDNSGDIEFKGGKFSMIRKVVS